MGDINKKKPNYELDGLKDDNLTDGPKTYHIDEETLDVINTDLSYRGIEKIVLLVEDKDDLRKDMHDLAKDYFSEDSKTSLCVVSNVEEVENHLKKYREFSSDALMYSVLDYNMGENEPGNKKPSEGLFHKEAFKHYLNNGGALIYYTGFHEDVIKSDIIMSSQRNYNNLVLLIAPKDASRIEPKDVVDFLSKIK